METAWTGVQKGVQIAVGETIILLRTTLYLLQAFQQ